MQTSVRPSVRVIVRFMCYTGFKGCCKRQEQSRGAKKGPVGSIRFKNVQEGSSRFKKVQEGSRRFKKVQQGSTWFNKVQKGLIKLKNVQER